VPGLILLFSKQGIVAHSCNPRTQEAEARESRVQGQP
jgi:hypothetical protein